MTNKKADQINLELNRLQQKWYDDLSQCYKDYNNFSSPFCFGVCQRTIDENAKGKPLLMFAGEEARDWCFDKNQQADLDYLQGYAISYFERQFCDNFNFEQNKFAQDYPQSFKNKNTSKFWSFLKTIKQQNNLALCWNNLDKLHRIKNNKTLPLSCSQEDDLHNIPCKNGKSLLLSEINLLQPDVVVFVKYVNSIAKALGIDKNQLLQIKTDCQKQNLYVADISDLCRQHNLFDKKDTVALFLLNHPNCRKKDFLSQATKQTTQAINRAIK